MNKSIRHLMARTRAKLTCATSGEGYVDTGVKILIAVVIGSLLLYGLYSLFKVFILPKISTQIKTLFDQSANTSSDAAAAVAAA